jgi:hypothetical protein
MIALPPLPRSSDEPLIDVDEMTMSPPVAVNVSNKDEDYTSLYLQGFACKRREKKCLPAKTLKAQPPAALLAMPHCFTVINAVKKKERNECK